MQSTSNPLRQCISSIKSNWNDKIKLGHLQLKNRIVMSAMTRVRCDFKTGIPDKLVSQYYTQRAGSGLILTECVAWTSRGNAYPGAAHLYTKQQQQGWKQVVQSVHSKEGIIFVQIYHGGRACRQKRLQNNLQPVAPSALRIRDLNFNDGSQFDVPHALTIEQIQETQKQFRNTVFLAKQAGFDGIQLHGANGYLIDQFLRSGTNIRTDKYGGSAQNRCRFAVQLVDIALQFFQPYQIGIKVSPTSRFGDMYDDNPVETYTTLAKLLDQRKIGFIQAKQQNNHSQSKQQFPKLPLEQVPDVSAMLRPFFNGLIIGNSDFNSVTGLEKIRSGNCDLISFARLYIPNPDLAQRIINNLELNANTDYTALFRGKNGENLGAKGYTDYPFYQQWKKQLAV